jgi:hypothetical protein
MRVIKKTFILSKEEYYTKHLSIINPLLPQQMTPKEIEVVACFLSLEGDLAKDPFSTTGRKIVRDRLDLSPGGLGNYINQLRDKKFLIVKEDKLLILPILMPSSDEQTYHLKLEIQKP